MVAWLLSSKMGLSRVGVAAASRCHGVLGSKRVWYSLSLSPLPFFSFIFSFFPSFLAFPFGFGVFCLVFFSFFLFFIFYIFFKSFHGLLLLGWPAGTGMVEVRGA